MDSGSSSSPNQQYRRLSMFRAKVALRGRVLPVPPSFALLRHASAPRGIASPLPSDDGRDLWNVVLRPSFRRLPNAPPTLPVAMRPFG